MNSKNMTECEMYITLAIRHLKVNRDPRGRMTPMEQVKCFARIYKTQVWENCGHPCEIGLRACRMTCARCWEEHIKEFIEKGLDYCNL